MKYDQIKADIFEFKRFIEEEELDKELLLGPLLLELCLLDKGIYSSIVKGFLVEDDRYWTMRYWNKIEVNGQIKQIDPCPGPHDFKAKKRIFHSLTLEDKWKFLYGESRQQFNYVIVNNYSIYLKNGANFLLNSLKSCIYDESVRSSWKRLANKAKRLETFESIEKYLNFN
ncbi:hypothetical protein CONCODRAFT_74203 [Conidiobolus coronatus NRRL 28638]|uniref:Uncharacterized protein n=1 Tax=Conidiobolus coronatus (strain ATCC 28846 / CBS 209.66 / NRRL 28638) TaxID=796925 RepID=A0A137NSC6_CONC2|nr:hypothetical protein CONCODRAFT_74203 [Conidiobolus coronatus NRRL 28638]|eukprot:KXN65592.1 hypothetical protein CONCODRAFT_74203 [Conidiobolus coronatus NRRL 28638]